MTREEAIKTLQELWRETNDSWYEEAYDMAIEALSQPIVCKDYCIDDDHIYCSPKVADRVVEALKDRAQGEWIKKQVFNPELDKYVPLIECSVCGYEPYFGGSEPKFNYCANCGARMEK